MFNCLQNYLKLFIKSPVDAWFLAGAGVKYIGRGRGLPPGELLNFGRGREGPGAVILAVAGTGARAPVEH